MAILGVRSIAASKPNVSTPALRLSVKADAGNVRDDRGKVGIVMPSNEMNDIPPPTSPASALLGHSFRICRPDEAEPGEIPKAHAASGR